MKFEKTNPELAKLFDEIAPGPEKKGVEKRTMFGYPCRFINGNMFIGMHNNMMILRLSEKDRKDFSRLGAKPFEPMPGRPMKEYLVVPKEMMIKKSADLKTWIDKSAAFASALPPKQKKKRNRN